MGFSSIVYASEYTSMQVCQTGIKQLKQLQHAGKGLLTKGLGGGAVGVKSLVREESIKRKKKLALFRRSQLDAECEDGSGRTLECASEKMGRRYKSKDPSIQGRSSSSKQPASHCPQGTVHVLHIHVAVAVGISGYLRVSGYQVR
ncbi:predicted protein [Histoplasma mississippiense (nom. inval.)]|uniref:predicted protein n=1 Tax=Ajellomyces capsulatus (strain NAm1 / WU24) TaxID=2059318 RepID=UPI000157BAEE|nr:predicted protein [Histoplasma mississippiense (nom. inval.)]EDN04148.1 predicted protein [Histoplasma mississippiense (nom. inval.)]